MPGLKTCYQSTAWCLEKLAEAAILEVQPLPHQHRRQALLRAVQVFATAASLRASVKSVIDPADLPEYERMIGELHATLGETAFMAAWDKGNALPIAEVIDLALSPAIPGLEIASLTSAQADKAKFGGLTAQERKAAVLIAQGKTNREIAKAMNVQLKTVESYVTRMLNKLNIDSRVKIATWVVKVGLEESDSDDR